MYLRRCYREKDGKRHGYWALVESYRTVRGPRQRVVAYLGELDEQGRLGLKRCAEGAGDGHQGRLFDEVEPQWVEIDLKRVRVERTREMGGPWVGLELLRRLDLVGYLEEALPAGREAIPWAMMSVVLVLARLCEPSSELYLAEHYYDSSALEELLGVPRERVNEDRLYRALDRLLPKKVELERHLSDRLGTLFALDYDLLLYDVTSTYFEGEALGNAQARRGYSRDHRGDCKQVNIALVVTREGVPLGYELFAGNRADVTTVKEIIETMEQRFGKAGRIWVMDRGMMSEENVKYLKETGRRYIVGTPKGKLRRFERYLLEAQWQEVREGLEVRMCPAPSGEEVFILCRSAERQQKERAIHERFEQRMEEGLRALQASCQDRKQSPVTIAERVGRLLERNGRAAKLYQIEVGQDARGAAQLRWSKSARWQQWARLSEGCYLLRSNVTDWSAEDLWRAYTQLTEAEAAFRIQKSDLQIRPIWHQKAHRVQAHILVCFLAYVLWKTLGQLCRRAGLGDEPRKVFADLRKIHLVDVVLPTRNGVEIRKRCISRPTEHQAILLQRLGLNLPSQLEMVQM